VRTSPRSVPLVLMDEPIQNIAAVDLRPRHGFRVQAGIGRVKVEAPMRVRCKNSIITPLLRTR
jgi:hypothetical protein